jgi:hypothetical protein
VDNCEHVIAACAATVDALLKAHGSLIFLCTPDCRRMRPWLSPRAA